MAIQRATPQAMLTLSILASRFFPFPIMARLVLMVLLCLLIDVSWAQTKKIDSLRSLLNNRPQVDTFRVNRLNDLAFELSSLSTTLASDSAHRQFSQLVNQAMDFAKRLRYPAGQARAMYNLAIVKFYTQQPKPAQHLLAQAQAIVQVLEDPKLQWEIVTFTAFTYSLEKGNQALPYLQQSMKLAKTIGQASLLAQSASSFAQYYQYRYEYMPALSWHFQALSVSQKANDSATEVATLIMIARIYLTLTDYDQALVYLQQARQKLGPPPTITYTNSILNNLGNCYRLMGRYSQAVATYQQCLTVLVKDKNAQVPYVLTAANLADTYQRQSNPLAVSYGRQVLAQAQLAHSDPAISRVSVTLGRHYLRSRNADSALYFANQGYRLAQRGLDDKVTLRDACQILAGAYFQQGDFFQAYTYQSRYLAYKDSLSNEQLSRKATAARFSKQMSRQQSQIGLLTKDKQLQAEKARRQRWLLYSSLTVLMLIGGLLALVYRNNRQKQQTNRLLSQQKAKIERVLADLQTTQAQLIQKEKLASLGELTAGIAHEIQNPLNFVNNFSEVSTELIDELKEGPFQKLPDSEKEYAEEILGDLTSNLQKINHHGGRASNIVKGMLEHSRTDSGEKRPTDLNALADEYLKIAYHGLKAKDKGKIGFTCALVTDFDPTLEPVNVAPQEIGRVLLNIYNNAFYAVSERTMQSNDPDYKPTVSVSTNRFNNLLQIRIIDNGTGIPASIKAKIFQPFFTTKPTGEGTGLGLSLSYDIITKGYGGTLRVDSQASEGTTFVIDLPLL